MLKIRNISGLIGFELEKSKVICKCIEEPYTSEIVEAFKLIETNNEMADGCLEMIREQLAKYPCMHPTHSEKITDVDTPAMMYPEWIHCVVSRARIDGMNAILQKLHSISELSKLYSAAQVVWSVDKEVAKKVWSDWVNRTQSKGDSKNAMEKPV